MSREAMKRIKTWNERCEEHPDHQTGMISERMIQERMQEEIDELRQALAQPEQEPVAWLDAEMSQAYTIDELPDASGTGFLPLYTAPPKREWVGLTEKEWYAATGIPRNATLPMHMLKGIEKALKERNG